MFIFGSLVLMNAVTQKLFIEGGTKALDFLALESRRTIMPETCKFAGWKRWNWFFFFSLKAIIFVSSWESNGFSVRYF